MLSVCRPSGSSMEPALVSAWRALAVRPAADYRPPPAQAVYSMYTRSIHKHIDTHTQGRVVHPTADYRPPPPQSICCTSKHIHTRAFRLQYVHTHTHTLIGHDYPTRFIARYPPLVSFPSVIPNTFDKTQY